MVTESPVAPTTDGVIGVVVVNFGSHRLLEHNLGAGALPARSEVVVVDNFSSVQERADIRRLAEARGWHLVERADNGGFGTAVNAGVAAARTIGCACFLVLNPDAVVTADAVRELRAHVLAEPMAMVSPRIVTHTGSTYFAGSQVQLSSGRIRGLGRGGFTDGDPRTWLTGACLAVHSDLYDRIGGFDDDFFLYWEDVDLSYRAESAGGSLVVRNDVVVVHDEGGTQIARSSRAKSDAYYYFNCRNRLLFAAKHLPRRTVLRWIAMTPSASWEILMRGGRRQLVESPKPLLAAIRGSVRGVGMALAAVARRRTPALSRTTAPPRLLVAHPSADLYGSDRVLLESVEAMVGSGWNVVVTVPSSGPLVAEIEARGAAVRLCRTPVVRKSALRPRGLLRLVGDAVFGLLPAIRLVRSAGADGVYVNTITVPTWIVLGRLLRRPVTAHVHEAEGSASPVVRRLISAPVALAHTVVVNSRFSLGVLTGAVGRVAPRACVVYNGVPGPTIVVPARERLDGPVRLLFIGRLSPRKGPQVAVAALRDLVAGGTDAHLSLLGAVFPGYEWFEEELRAAVRDGGLEDRVTFLDFQPDIWPHVASTDIVIVPSVVDEPFGNTAVEAVLAARPLVVSATSGLMEAAAGYASAQSVRPDDPQDLADAVRYVVADWITYRDRAVADAGLAAERHSVQRYRDDIARIVTTLGRSRP